MSYEIYFTHAQLQLVLVMTFEGDLEDSRHGLRLFLHRSLQYHRRGCRPGCRKNQTGLLVLELQEYL